MRKLVLASLAVLTMAALAWATDVWKKPYEQWDKKDVAKVLNDSPWGKTVRISASWQSSGGSMPTENPQMQQPQGGQPSSGGSEAGGGGRPGGMGGGGGMSSGSGGAGGVSGVQSGGTPMATFVVRWVSAKTMREAFVRNAELSGQMNQSQAQQQLSQTADVYQVMVAGPDMLPFEQSTEEAVKNSADLEVKKSKEKIQPVKVEFQRSPDGQKVQDVIIEFPKTANGQPTIGPDAKGADFSVSLSRAKIRASFDFSKMSDAQGRDL
ncbi:MAG TPA: hypothetical protein VMF66_01750 [Candidatus Acidoferrum sp.]|nr:hypothetical protein [Candidatus Acidoferrum sp.]